MKGENRPTMKGVVEALDIMCKLRQSSWVQESKDEVQSLINEPSLYDMKEGCGYFTVERTRRQNIKDGR